MSIRKLYMMTDVTGLHIFNDILNLIYTRKSQEPEDKQVTSNEDQLKLCKKLALDKFGIDIPEGNIISDSKTAKVATVRPGFNRLKRIIDWAIQKNIKVRIFCWKANRCSRNGQEGGLLADFVRDKYLEIVSEKDGSFNFENFFFLFVFFGMGSQQSKDIADGVLRNNEHKISLGIYPARSPLGYMFDPVKLKGQKDHIPNPKNWTKCKAWVELMLTGNFTVEESLQIMTSKGLVDNKGGQVSSTKAYVFFRDPFYIGLFKSNGVVHKGIHKPLMTMAEYNKIQKIIDKRGHKNNWTNPLWFQGEVIRCGGCKGYVTGQKRFKKYTNGNSTVFYHARCTKKKGPCAEPYLNVYTTKNGEGLEDQVMNYIDEMETLLEYTDLIKRILKRRNEQEFMRAGKERELQTKRLAEIDKQKKDLYAMKIEGYFDNNPQEYEKQKTELLKQELLVKQEILPDSTAYWRKLLEDTCDFVLGMKNLFKNGDAYTKRMVLKILGSNLILKDRKLKIEAKTAFIAIKGVQKEVENLPGWLEPKTVKEKTDTIVQSGYSTPNTSVQYRVRESNP